MMAAHRSVNRADIGIGTSSNNPEMNLIGASETETLNNERATRDSIRSPGFRYQKMTLTLALAHTIRPHWFAVRRTDAKNPSYQDILETGQRKQHRVFIISCLQVVVHDTGFGGRIPWESTVTLFTLPTT
jgi:hypothetical protein